MAETSAIKLGDGSDYRDERDASNMRPGTEGHVEKEEKSNSSPSSHTDTGADLDEVRDVLQDLIAKVESGGDDRSEALRLEERSKVLSDSGSVFLKLFHRQAGEIAVMLANCIDEVVCRHAAFPINLPAASDACADGYRSYLFDANPVKVHLDCMVAKVEERIEKENRAVILSQIDSIVTKIKRRERRKEPSRVLRFLDNDRNHRSTVASFVMSNMFAQVSKIFCGAAFACHSMRDA